MAKLIFYLTANNHGLHSVTTAARDFAQSAFADEHSLQCAIMHPRDEDVLAIPPDSDFLQNLHVVLEVQAPAGTPMQPWLDALVTELASLLHCIDAAMSHVFAVTPRVFQNNGARKQRYHYLMFRAQHFSRSDYLDYYMNSHYRFGIVTPLANYIQNYSDPNTTAQLALALGMQPINADNFSELHFDDINDYLHCDAILEAGPAASADEALFVHRDLCQSFSMNVVFETGQASRQGNT